MMHRYVCVEFSFSGVKKLKHSVNVKKNHLKILMEKKSGSF